jgi:orotate phosphoribosyltransferase
MKDEVAELIPARRGYFQFESGHHGELWLDLELLCLHPEPVQRLAERLAARLLPYEVEAVCGPLVEGAFIALMLASELHVPFTYSERFENFGTDALYPVEYRIPSRLREELQGKRVAIVNDVINAGSAVLGTLVDLEACGAEVRFVRVKSPCQESSIVTRSSRPFNLLLEKAGLSAHNVQHLLRRAV